MKIKKLKKNLGFIAVLLIAFVAMWNVNVNSQTNGMSDIMLANAEALANDEQQQTGPPLTNWKAFPMKCTTTSLVEFTAGIPIPVGGQIVIIGGKTYVQTTSTFDGSKCGMGTGFCWSDSC